MFAKLIIANFKEMFTDKTHIFWFILFPVIFVAVFGVLFSNAGQETGTNGSPVKVVYDVGIASSGEARLSDELKKHFEQAAETNRTLKLHASGKTGEIDAFKKSQRHALLMVPPGFVENIKQNIPVHIDLYFDVMNTGVLFAVGETVSLIEKRIDGSPALHLNPIPSAEFQRKFPAAGGKDNVKNSDKKSKKGATRLNQLDFMLSGVLALSLMQFGLFGSLRVLNLRAQGTLKTLGTTPMPRTVFLASEIAVRLVWSLLQGIIIVVLSYYVFGLTVTGSWLAIVGWMTLGTAAFIAMGYMLTTLVKTPEGGNALIQVVQFPMMLLAGIFMPPETMPQFIQPVVDYMPLAYLADGLRSSMTGIASAYGAGVNVLVLVGILIVSLIVTTTRFTWE